MLKSMITVIGAPPFRTRVPDLEFDLSRLMIFVRLLLIAYPRSDSGERSKSCVPGVASSIADC